MNIRSSLLALGLSLAAMSPSQVSGQNETRRAPGVTRQDPERQKRRIEELREEARIAIEQLQTAPGGGRGRAGPLGGGRRRTSRQGNPHQDLLWIGPHAVPEIVAAIDANWSGEKRNHQFCSTLLQIMWRIGGEESVSAMETYTRHGDVEFRRLLATTINGLPEPLAAKAAALLGDTDDEGFVRLHATKFLYQNVPALQIVNLAGDPIAAVRVQAFQTLRGWMSLKHEPDPETTLRAAVPMLQRGLEDPDPGVSQAAFGFLATGVVLPTPEGRDLLLRWLLQARFPGAFGVDWPQTGEVDLGHRASVTEVARALGMVSQTRNPNPNQQVLIGFVHRSLRDWDRRAFGEVLELARLGYARGVAADWLAEHARDDEVDEVCAVLDDTSVTPKLAEWLSEHDLPASACPSILAVVNRYVGQNNGWHNADLPPLLHAAARTGAEDLVGALVAYLDQGLPTAGAAGLPTSNVVIPALCELARRRGDAATMQVLRGILARRGSIPLASRAQLFETLRTHAAMTLREAMTHAHEPVRLAALRTLEAPLADADFALLGELLPSATQAVVLTAAPLIAGTGGAATAKILEDLFAHRDAQVRRKAVESAALLRGTLPAAQIVPLLGDADCEVRVAACALLGQLTDTAAVDPLLEALRDPSEEVRAAAREALSAIRFYHEQKGFWEQFRGQRKDR